MKIYGTGARKVYKRVDEGCSYTVYSRVFGAIPVSSDKMVNLISGLVAAARLNITSP